MFSTTGCQFDLSADTGRIVSPGYQSDLYPNILQCEWTIQVQAGRTLTLTFSPAFGLEDGKDFLQVRWQLVSFINIVSCKERLWERLTMVKARMQLKETAVLNPALGSKCWCPSPSPVGGGFCGLVFHCLYSSPFPMDGGFCGLVFHCLCPSPFPMGGGFCGLVLHCHAVWLGRDYGALHTEWQYPRLHGTMKMLPWQYWISTKILELISRLHSATVAGGVFWIMKHLEENRTKNINQRGVFYKGMYYFPFLGDCWWLSGSHRVRVHGFHSSCRTGRPKWPCGAGHGYRGNRKSCRLQRRVQCRLRPSQWPNISQHLHSRLWAVHCRAVRSWICLHWYLHWTEFCWDLLWERGALEPWPLSFVCTWVIPVWMSLVWSSTESLWLCYHNAKIFQICSAYMSRGLLM